MTTLARLAWISIGLASWAALIYGSTQLRKLDLPLHSICGPWGCAAAPEALLSYHAVWAAVLIPAVVIACRMLGRTIALRVCWISFALGSFGLLVLFAGGALSWLFREGGSYAIQRGLFVLATTSDIPALQMMVAGLFGRIAVIRMPRPVEPESLEGENQEV